MVPPELSVGLFSSTHPNTIHQITDPTQPSPLPGELMDPWPNPTHTQPNHHTSNNSWPAIRITRRTAIFHKTNLPVDTRYNIYGYTTCIFHRSPFRTHDPTQPTENENFGPITDPIQPSLRVTPTHGQLVSGEPPRLWGQPFLYEP